MIQASASPVTKERRDRFLSRQSVIEMRARERARALLDHGSFRELLGPFDRLESPWLPLQGVVPESDDGVIIARGQLAGRPAVIMAIEGAFQGGGMGEVSASKIAGALALARRDCEDDKPILPVLLLETGGVRLQEANLGEAAVAEIHAEIIALRRHVPVIGVITGMGRLFRRHVDCRRLVQLSGDLPAGATRTEWPRSDRAGGGHRRAGRQRQAPDLEPDGRRAALRNRLRRHPGRG